MTRQVATLIESVATPVTLELLELQMIAQVVMHVGKAMGLELVANEAGKLLLLPARLFINRYESAVVLLQVKAFALLAPLD